MMEPKELLIVPVRVCQWALDGNKLVSAAEEVPGTPPPPPSTTTTLQEIIQSYMHDWSDLPCPIQINLRSVAIGSDTTPGFPSIQLFL